jgi:ankyrin repeat protein
MNINLPNTSEKQKWNDLLLHSSEYNNPNGVLEALKNGADVNTRGEWNRTPLHFAAENCLKDIAQILIQAGANLGAVDEYGDTPLMLSLTDEDCFETLMLLGSFSTPQQLALKNKSGDSLLHLALISGNYTIVKVILHHFQDVNIKNKNGSTPIFIVVANLLHKYGNYTENINILNLLLEKGANINIKNKDEYTPVLAAAMQNNSKILQLLLSTKKYNIHIKYNNIFGDNKNETLLEMATDGRVFSKEINTMIRQYYKSIENNVSSENNQIGKRKRNTNSNNNMNTNLKNNIQMPSSKRMLGGKRFKNTRKGKRISKRTKSTRRR